MRSNHFYSLMARHKIASHIDDVNTAESKHQKRHSKVPKENKK